MIERFPYLQPLKKSRKKSTLILNIKTPFLQPNVLSKKKKLTKEEIKDKLPKELMKNVSHYVGTLADEHLFYNKTIIIKDEDKNSLQVI